MKIQNKKIKLFKNKKAFSIGEVLISVFIVAVALVTMLGTMTKTIGNYMQNRDRIVASMLAQEGVELVRNIRDNNFLNAPSAFDGLGAGNSYNIDYNSSLSSSGFQLGYSDSSGYLHSGGTSTKFFRRIIIRDVTATEITIDSIVNFDASNPPDNYADCSTDSHCVYASSTLTDWDVN